jgi:DNA-binding transcriptional LysR family regulator
VSFPRKSRQLTALPWRQEKMVLTCSPNHPLAQLKTVPPVQLAGEKYIGFDKGLVIRRQVDRFLRQQGVAVEIALEFDNIENIKQAIEISAGVALLPEPTLRREVQSGTLVAVPLADCQMVRPLGIIHRRQHRLGATARSFIDLLRRSEGPAFSYRPDLGTYASGTGSQTTANGSHRLKNGSTRASKRTVVT